MLLFYKKILTNLAVGSFHASSIVVDFASRYIVVIVALCHLVVRVDVYSEIEKPGGKVSYIHPLTVRMPVVNIVAVW